MQRFLMSLLMAFLFSVLPMSLYLLGGMFWTTASHGNLEKFYSDTLVVGIICVFGLTNFFYWIHGLVEERNREGRERMEKARRELLGSSEQQDQTAKDRKDNHE